MEVLDIPTVIPILLAAYGRPIRDSGAFERSLRRSTNHALVAVDGESALGTVAVEIYEHVAYIGGMGVAPPAQRRGIGTALLRQVIADAEMRGVRTFLLDATAEGEALYRRYGFVDAGGVETWERLIRERAVTPEVADIDETTFDEVLALDAATFGARRDALLADYATEARGKIFRARAADGALVAAAFVRGPIIGPWCALAPRAAASALDLALAGTAVASRTVFVPVENRHAAEILTARGFSRGRHLVHMRRGDTHRMARENLYGQASLGTG